MKPSALPLLTAAALFLPACTQSLQAAWNPPSKATAHVKAGPYAVEPYHGQVLFNVTHFGPTNDYGNFSRVSGMQSVSPKNSGGMSVSISVSVASIATTSIKLASTLKSADWLDATGYPTMAFRSTTVTQTGADTADIAGTLTLHGVTKPPTLHAVFNGEGVNMLDHKDTLGFQLAGTLQRIDFDVSKYAPW